MTDPDAVVHEARAAVAAGGEPDWAELEARIRALALDDDAERRALARLHRVATVHRARARLGEPAAPPPAPAVPRRPRGRAAPVASRPTLTGTIELRRERRGDDYLLAWQPDRAVGAWEVRIGVRADARSAYVDRASVELPPETTSIVLPLADGALRVHVLGRGRGGRLVQRALASGLTRENWDARWQRRPSAA